MAKFRTNHTKQRAGESGKSIVRIGVFLLIIAVFFIAGRQIFKTEKTVKKEAVKLDVEHLAKTGLDSIFFLPTTVHGAIILHQYIGLSYSHQHNSAEWVAYELTADRVETDKLACCPELITDPKMGNTDTLLPQYNRQPSSIGLLAPVEHFRFSQKALQEIHYFSNCIPFHEEFDLENWQTLNEKISSWARQFQHLYVVTGPIWPVDEPEEPTSDSSSIPEAFYKVVLDLREPELKAIAFIIPNGKSGSSIKSFVTVIDEVERRTGIDFFYNLLPEDLEQQIESVSDLNDWEPDNF